jgi:hypothetical protein
MARPLLTTHLRAEDFRDFYWLKKELMSFCRKNGLSAAGSKEELQVRVEIFLARGVVPDGASGSETRRRRVKMPQEFYPETVIAPGWCCNQRLRAFFEREIGPQFHFDRTMRDFVAHGAGRTLRDALDAWERNRKSPKEPKHIGRQFEYNKHIRLYFQEHPHAALSDAIQAWREMRAKRRIAE